MRQSGDLRTPTLSRAGRLSAKFIPGFRIKDRPNMPKLYPCPECGATSKRARKLPVGAMYKYKTHGEFLIRR